MSAFLHWLAHSPIASAAKVFASVMLAVSIADWQASGTIHFNDWQTWVIAALASCLPVLVNWLNPADPRYRGPRKTSPSDANDA